MRVQQEAVELHVAVETEVHQTRSWEAAMRGSPLLILRVTMRRRVVRTLVQVALSGHGMLDNWVRNIACPATPESRGIALGALAEAVECLGVSAG